MPFKKPPEKKSPFKAKPLRAAGQSLAEEMDDISENAYTYISVSVMSIGLAGHEWWRWYSEAPPSPVALSIAALFVTVLSVFKLVKLRNQLKRLKLAQVGEKIVGEQLEKLRSGGYRVFHDLVGDSFNVDHVIIGSAGVFTVETKSYSKPAKGKANIDFDGSRVLINGYEPDQNPVIQSKAQITWVQELIESCTGKKYKVRGFIAYPGWFVEWKGIKAYEVDVLALSPKVLPKVLSDLPAILSPDDIKFISNNLSRTLREK